MVFWLGVVLVLWSMIVLVVIFCCWVEVGVVRYVVRSSCVSVYLERVSVEGWSMCVC